MVSWDLEVSAVNFWSKNDLGGINKKKRFGYLTYFILGKAHLVLFSYCPLVTTRCLEIKRT